MSAGDRLIIDGEDDEQSLMVRETKDGFLFDVYEAGIYASAGLTAKDIAVLVEWLRDMIEGVDE